MTIVEFVAIDLVFTICEKRRFLSYCGEWDLSEPTKGRSFLQRFFSQLACTMEKPVLLSRLLYFSALL